MSVYTIRVIIEERHGYKVAEACAPMGSAFQDAIQPLKMSDSAMPFFDTPVSVVHRVRADRKQYAEILTPKIAQVLLDAMAAKDLFNGYTKGQQKDWASTAAPTKEENHD